MRWSAFVILALAAFVLAQAPQPFNPFAGLYAPESKEIQNGVWTMYKVEDSGEGKSGKMKFSVVGDAECAGKKCHWFEMEMWDKNGDHDIIKFLGMGVPTQKDESYASVIIKHNDEPAYEFGFDIPPDTTQTEQPTAKATAKPAVSKRQTAVTASDERYDVTTSTETITVPAGTFKCSRMTRIDKENNERADVWYTEDVPMPGIVKVDAEDTKMELLEYGTEGATSAITETPVKFNMEEMMKQQMKQSMEEKAEEGSKEAVDDAINRQMKSIFGR